MHRGRQDRFASLIFVFGSNLAGRHGKGAALDAARYWGAITGQGEGMHGQSYAIPTKNSGMRSLSLREIGFYVYWFLAEAAGRPDLDFQVTRVGCGLAGYSDREIAPLFKGATPNVHLPLSWKPYLSRD